MPSLNSTRKTPQIVLIIGLIKVFPGYDRHDIP